MRRLGLALLLAGCSDSPPPAVIDAAPPLDAPARQGAGPGGGLLPDLSFAVVGDTRPANLDDTAGYPTDLVRQIWSDVEAVHPQFALSTGDYMFASAQTGTQVNPQLDLYLGARASYSGFVYAAMGNHECNGYTDSNCGGSNGTTPNYDAFMSRMINPIGESSPWFIERFAAIDGSWSAKFIFIAANAWTDAQDKWLATMLLEPTTYTFVIRHEPPESSTAPGVGPSTVTIAKHPLTMLITGHTHTYRHVPAYREIIVGNGGAPLTSGTNYGYVIVARQPDGTLQVTSYDYLTNTPIDQFAITANGVAP